jgi:hypothetical protein
MLAALATLLAGLHTIGAALGAAGATYAEVFYAKATADGRIDTREKSWIATTYWSLSWGMTVVLLTGIALTIVEYFLPDAPQGVLYAPLWMQDTLALVVTVVAWCMVQRLASWTVGSSLIFAGWWMMLALDAWRTVSVPYVWLLFVYALAVAASAALWGYVRLLFRERAKVRK